MSLFAELKRRNVVRVAIAYVVGAWLLLQFTDVMIGLMELPAYIGKVVVFVLLLGFLPAVIFAWVWELTPEGLKRERDIDRGQTTTTNTGRKLNAVILVMLAVAAGYFFWESRFKQESAPSNVAFNANNDAKTPFSDSGRDASDKSVAVLPFVNLSTDPENEFFADGLSEEILNRLAQVNALRVIGRTSSFSFKGQNRDLREIGQILDASSLLEGSVRRQGNLVRVTAQLIASANGTQLWSQSYDREMDDVFAIQDEIAQNVVDALDVILDETTRQAMLDVGVRNVDAFIAYQKGYQLLLDGHGSADMMSELFEANRLFDQAIDAAPGFAEAFSAKTDYFGHVVLDEDFSRSLDERETALQTMLSLYQVAWEKAHDSRRRLTIDIDRTFFSEDWSRLPGLIEALFNSDGCADGNWMELMVPFVEPAKLLAHYQRQMACDPLTLLSAAFVADFHYRVGDVKAAQATLDEARKIGGDHRWLDWSQFVLDIRSGKAESMLAEFQNRASAENPRLVDQMREITLLALLGRQDEARVKFDRLRESNALQPSDELRLAAQLGDRGLANALAADMDRQPGGRWT